MSEWREAVAQLALRDDVLAADIERIGALVAATRLFSDAEIAIARELVAERLAKGAVSGYEFLMAECGGELAGYACYGAVPATASSFALYWIAVEPGWQGRGLGRRLLAEVRARAAAAGGMRLYAETSSRAEYAPTVAFYRASNFLLVAFLPEHFAPGDGKLIFELPLRDPH